MRTPLRSIQPAVPLLSQELDLNPSMILRNGKRLSLSLIQDEELHRGGVTLQGIGVVEGSLHHTPAVAAAVPNARDMHVLSSVQLAQVLMVDQCLRYIALRGARIEVDEGNRSLPLGSTVQQDRVVFPCFQRAEVIVDCRDGRPKVAMTVFVQAAHVCLLIPRCPL